jgi:hypothetical protein
MKKKPAEVSTCIQCEGDAMLEVRKHASELFEAMDMITENYGHGHGATMPQWVRVLIDAERDQRRLIVLLRSSAERRVKDVDSLICALRFVSDCTKETYSSGMNIGGTAMSLQLTEIFRVAIHKLESLKIGDKGLIEGRQPQNERNFVAELIAKLENKEPPHDAPSVK